MDNGHLAATPQKKLFYNTIPFSSLTYGEAVFL